MAALLDEQEPLASPTQPQSKRRPDLVKRALTDPTFFSLSASDRRILLSQHDPDFAAKSASDQDDILSQPIAAWQSAFPTPQEPGIIDRAVGAVKGAAGAVSDFIRPKATRNDGLPSPSVSSALDADASQSRALIEHGNEVISKTVPLEKMAGEAYDSYAKLHNKAAEPDGLVRASLAEQGGMLTPPNEISRGVATGVAGVVEPMTSVKGMVILAALRRYPIGSWAPVLQMAGQLGFAAPMLYSAVTNAPEVWDAYKSGDREKLVNSAIKVVADATFGAAAAKGFAKNASDWYGKFFGAIKRSSPEARFSAAKDVTQEGSRVKDVGLPAPPPVPPEVQTFGQSSVRPKPVKSKPVPESTATLDLQKQAFVDGTKPAMFFPFGSRLPDRPDGALAFRAGNGTWWVRNESDKEAIVEHLRAAKGAAAKESAIAQVLGIVAPKTTASSEVVTARLPEPPNTEILSAATQPQDVPAQAASLQQQFPEAVVEAKPVEQAAPEIVAERERNSDLKGKYASQAIDSEVQPEDPLRLGGDVSKTIPVATKPGGMPGGTLSLGQMIEKQGRILQGSGYNVEAGRIDWLDTLLGEGKHSVVSPVSYGTWEGAEPNFRISFDKSVPLESLEHVASLFGEGYGQDAVAIASPNSQVKTYRGLILEKPDGKEFTPEEVELLAKSSTVVFESDPSNKSIIFSNWSGQDDFVDAAIEAVQKSGFSAQGLAAWAGDSVLVNREQFRGTIEKARDKARATGSPDISERVLDQLRQAYEAEYPRAVEQTAATTSAEQPREVAQQTAEPPSLAPPTHIQGFLESLAKDEGGWVDLSPPGLTPPPGKKSYDKIGKREFSGYVKKAASYFMEGDTFSEQKAWEDFSKGGSPITRDSFTRAWKEAVRLEAGKIKGLTEDERGQLTRASTIRRVVATVRAFPPEEDSIALAKIGEIKKGWYKRAGAALHVIFPLADDFSRFTKLLAALSPQQGVRANLEMAIRVWTGWDDAGRPTDNAALSGMIRPTVREKEIDQFTGKPQTVYERHPDTGKIIYDTDSESGARTPRPVIISKGTVDIDARVNNSIAALQDGDLSGHKVRAFHRNLAGDPDPVTNDTHMARAYGVEQALFGGPKFFGYFAASARTRVVAKRLGWEPREAQETIWSAFKTIYDAARKKDRSAVEIVTTITPQQVAEGGVEFATLLLDDNEIIGQLARLGVDVAALKRSGAFSEADYRPEEFRGTEEIDPRILKRIGERAEGYRSREGKEELRGESEQEAQDDLDFEFGAGAAKPGQAAEEPRRLKNKTTAELLKDTGKSILESVIGGESGQLAPGGSPQLSADAEKRRAAREKTLDTIAELLLRGQDKFGKSWKKAKSYLESNGIPPLGNLQGYLTPQWRAHFGLKPGRALIAPPPTKSAAMAQPPGVTAPLSPAGAPTSPAPGAPPTPPTGPPPFMAPPPGGSGVPPLVQSGMAKIDFEGKAHVESASLLRQIETKIFDDLAPIRHLEKDFGNTGDILNSAYNLARLARGAPGKAHGFVKYGPQANDGTILGPSLRDALDGVGDTRGLSAYLAARRVVELSSMGKIKIDQKTGEANTKLTPTEADAIIAYYEQLHPEWGSVGGSAEKVYAFENAALDYGVQNGAFSKDKIDAIKSANKAHVPLQRVLDGFDSGKVESSGRIASKPLPGSLKKFAGSERMIIDPLESIVKNTYTIVDLVEKNKAMLALARYVDNNPAVQPHMRKVAPPMDHIRTKVDTIEKQLIAAGADLTGVNMNEVIEFFQPATQVLGKRNIVSVLDGGKRKYYEVSNPDIFMAITAVGTTAPDMAKRLILPAIRVGSHELIGPTDISKIPEAASSLLRAGATTTLGFVVRNPLRDNWTAWVQSRYGFRPGYDFMRGLFEYLGDGEGYRLFLNANAGHSALVSGDRDMTRDEIARIHESPMRRLFSLRGPLDGLRAVSEAMENATRMGEFMRGIEYEGRTESGMARAGLSSRDVTIDFRRGGTISKEMNRQRAFFNAGMQGPYRLQEAIRDNPSGSMFKILLGITLPSLVLWYLNHDNGFYQERSDSEKKAYWHIPLAGTKGDKFALLPKPFELATVFGDMFASAADFAVGRNRDAKERMFPDADTAWSLLFSLVPTWIAPLLEVGVNKNLYTKRQIVQEHDTNLPPELQHNRWTSDVARKIGSIARVSPSKIDHVIYGYGAGVARGVVDATSWIGRAAGAFRDIPEKPDSGWRKVPLIGALYREGLDSSSESLNRFYKDLDEIRGVTRGTKIYQKAGDAGKADELKGTDLFARRQKVIAGDKQMEFQRKALRRVFEDRKKTPDQKRQEVDAIYYNIVNIARRAIGESELPPPPTP